MTHNELSSIIINTAIEIHRQLGPGLLESVYLAVLEYELKKRGLNVQKEVPIPVQWDNLHLEIGSRADLIVEGMVLVELKSVEELAAVHKKQVLTYVKLTDLRLGLLVNFGAELLKHGLHRIINGTIEEEPNDPPNP